MLHTLRHVTSINDLTNDEIGQIFALAKGYLTNWGSDSIKHRIARSSETAAGKILATLFYEPSTRTRLSFESATLRLGGGTISSADPTTSSAAKGESLADTVRVISSYADVLVIRHPRDGAAKFAAEFAEIPVINGGDGSHEHPTQTLCDLFTLQQEKKSLKNLNVVISGDLKGSRTIHSFVYALARFGSNIMLMPGAKGMELPGHVDWRLRHEFYCRPIPKEQYEAKNADVDALYVTADQGALIQEIELTHVKLRKQVDAFYVTRFQKERWSEHKDNYLKIDTKFLRDRKYRDTSVLHPLPRVGELDPDIDKSQRAAYFRQAAYGVPVRMALIAALLDLTEFKLDKFDGGFGDPLYHVHSQSAHFGLVCTNSNCITHDETITANKFYIVQKDGLRLRCFYCETDVEHVVQASRKVQLYSNDQNLHWRPSDLIFFPNPDEAERRGYKLARRPYIAAAE